jgi:Zn-dependent peptidase ImmA (M78 family)
MDYLRQLQSTAVINAMDRPLHGCVVAIGGRGFIFVDGTDEIHEIRFTIAHEVAHFLLDYLQPRLRAVEKFGTDIEEVLDGQRGLIPDERIDVLLANASIPLYTHFMQRDARGFSSSAILEAESQSDRLAFELLAPEGEIWEALPKKSTHRTYQSRVMAVRRLLVRRFGLPTNAARDYATKLCRSRFGGPSVREWLGMQSL